MEQNLAPDEKATLVMVYTHDALVRGEVITKQFARVNIWPRTQGIPNFIHLLKPNVMLFGGSQPKPFSYFRTHRYSDWLSPGAPECGGPRL